MKMPNFLGGRVVTIEPHQADVIEFPTATLDAMARLVHELNNELVDVSAELSRNGIRYNTVRDKLLKAQEALCAKLTESGIKAEIARRPPELDL